MNYRRMEETDLKQVVLIEKDNFSMPWSYESFQSSRRKKENIYLVAEENGQIAGYCGVWVVAGEGQINNIAVRKDRQNQGIGRGLLTSLFEEGSKNKVESFTLEVRKSNINAIALYQKMGFKELGIRKDFYERPREDAIIMTVITSRNIGA